MFDFNSSILLKNCLCLILSILSCSVKNLFLSDFNCSVHFCSVLISSGGKTYKLNERICNEYNVKIDSKIYLKDRIVVKTVTIWKDEKIIITP